MASCYPFLCSQIECVFRCVMVTVLDKAGDKMKKPFKPCNKIGSSNLTREAIAKYILKRAPRKK